MIKEKVTKMGLFNKKIKNTNAAEPGKIYAPVTGRYIPVTDIPDEVFSAGILGIGCGIESYENRIVAPVDGLITTIAETKHAVGITTDEGAELLIHIGIDTVHLNGRGFEIKVKCGERITCGETLILFDKDEIKAAGYDSTIAFFVTNSNEFSEVYFRVNEEHKVTEEVGIIIK
jgi:PTS system beta-glucosides-specific IIC component